MDSEKRDMLTHTGESEALMLRLHEVESRSEELHSRRNEIISEIDDPPPVYYGPQIKTRFALLVYAGLAILTMNLWVLASIGATIVQSDLVVFSLLWVSTFIGLAFLLFAYVSTPSRKQLSFDAQSARRESLRTLNSEARRVEGELHHIYRRLDDLKRADTQAREV